MSGAMVHVVGLVGDRIQAQDHWWDVDELVKVC